MSLRRIALDARVAAEVPAGRGRYVRELISHLVPLLGDRRLELYARREWEGAPTDERVRWRVVSGGERDWPLRAGLAMRRGGCDAVLATSSYLMCAVAPSPVHSMVWDLAPFHPELHSAPGSGFERLTLPLAVRRCRTLVAISEATRRELGERHPRAAARTVVAPPAVGPAFSDLASAGDEQARARHDVGGRYVLALGTLEPRKNLPRLIEAFAALPDAVRGERRLVMAGAPGWETDDTFSRAAKHRGLVQTLGFVPDEDLPALLRGADAFCYPSLYEGFGIPVLEAMSCGVPVLISDVSSLPEVGGDAVRYCDPLDVDDIARGLRELLVDDELRRELARRGPERAARFTWAATARRVLEALEGGA